MFTKTFNFIEIKPPEDSAAHITNIKLQKQYSSLKFSIKEIQLKIKEAETAEQNSLLGREGLITELNLLNSNIAELNQIPDLSSHNALNLLDELQKNGELVNLSPYDRKLLEIKNGIEECDTKIKNHKKNCILLMTKLSENDSEEMASKKSVEFHQIVQEYNILTTKLNDMIVSRVSIESPTLV
ncbi:hypothetical protein HZS_5758 [Henneguya salminicola]|nr:hypothetical protein HZS_5758 [Henneguya salminicola]